MQTTIVPQKTIESAGSDRCASRADVPSLQLSIPSGLTPQPNKVPEILPNQGTGATAGAGASANGTVSPVNIGGAKSDNDDDTLSSSSSDGEDPEITAMKNEMIRYVNRGPPRPPSHGHAVPRNPRPLPQPTAGAPKQRPPAVTLGPGTTAKPKPK